MDAACRLEWNRIALDGRFEFSGEDFISTGDGLLQGKGNRRDSRERSGRSLELYRTTWKQAWEERAQNFSDEQTWKMPESLTRRNECRRRSSCCSPNLSVYSRKQAIRLNCVSSFPSLMTRRINLRSSIHQSGLIPLDRSGPFTYSHQELQRRGPAIHSIFSRRQFFSLSTT